MSVHYDHASIGVLRGPQRTRISDAACFMLKQLVCRENGSSDVDLSVRVQHALVEVDVCVAPEPLRLHEGSSRVCRMMVACPVVGTVAAGCAWARFTAFPVSLQSDQFFSVIGLFLAATRPW